MARGALLLLSTWHTINDVARILAPWAGYQMTAPIRDYEIHMSPIRALKYLLYAVKTNKLTSLNYLYSSQFTEMFQSLLGHSLGCDTRTQTMYS